MGEFVQNIFSYGPSIYYYMCPRFCGNERRGFVWVKSAANLFPENVV